MGILAIPEQKQTIQGKKIIQKKKNQGNAHCQTTAQKNVVSGQQNIVNSFATLFILLFLKEPAPIPNVLGLGGIF